MFELSLASCTMALAMATLFPVLVQMIVRGPFSRWSDLDWVEVFALMNGVLFIVGGFLLFQIIMTSISVSLGGY